MSNRIEQLTQELRHHLKTVQEVSAKADDAGRDFTAEERAAVAEAMGRAQEVKQRLTQAKADREVLDVVRELGEDVGLVESKSRPEANGFHQRTGGAKTLGQSFVDSKEYGDLLASAPGGAFSRDHRVQTRPVGYKSLLAPAGRGSKALVTGVSDTSAGAFVNNDYIGLQVGQDIFQRPLTLRDLVTGGNTTSDTVEYVRVTSITNNAAPVAEATTAAAPTAPGTAGALVPATGGGYKPESALATSRVTTPVRTIAHWIPVTKRALSDAAQIRTLIDSFLSYGLEEELEDQMVAGDGTGENFTGLANVSGVQVQAFSTDILTTTRKAKTKIRTVGRSIPTGYVMNPADVEALDLLQDGEKRFYFGGPSGTIQVGSATPLWNLPIIETEAVPAGTAYLGDWRKAVLWDREQSSITMSDSHQDFFTRNLVAILAEMRAAFGVLQPTAFVKIALA